MPGEMAREIDERGILLYTRSLHTNDRLTAVGCQPYIHAVAAGTGQPFHDRRIATMPGTEKTKQIIIYLFLLHFSYSCFYPILPAAGLSAAPAS